MILLLWWTYIVRIREYNAAGEGELSEGIEIITTDDVPDAPFLPSAYNINATSIRIFLIINYYCFIINNKWIWYGLVLSWEAPFSGGSVIASYTILINNDTLIVSFPLSFIHSLFYYFILTLIRRFVPAHLPLFQWYLRESIHFHYNNNNNNFDSF